MYTDKAIEYWNIQVNYEFKYYVDLDVFLWSIGQTIAVLLLTLGSFFKPFRWSLLSPFVVFMMQFTYVLRDEEWIQGDYYLLYTWIFMVTVLSTIWLTKYMITKIASILQKSKKKDVDTLVNFVIEVHNEHYAKILKSANSLEVLHEFDCSAEEKYTLRQILKRELQTGSKQFEVRVIQTLHKIDD